MESIKKFWLDAVTRFWEPATPLRRALIVGVPVVVVAAIGVGIALAITMGGGGHNAALAVANEAATDTPTVAPTITATPFPTETPASAGLASDAPPPGYTGGQAAPRQGGTGPGSAVDAGMTLSIPAIGVNAPVYSRSVGSSGVMGNPLGAYDVILYDFADGGWTSLGGFPGEPGANAVFAGHVDYIHIGPAVFWSIKELGPGDRITVNTPGGPVTYQVQFSEWADPNADFTDYVRKTGQDVITLVTCIGTFSGHEYSNRFVVRGVRV